MNNKVYCVYLQDFETGDEYLDEIFADYNDILKTYCVSVKEIEQEDVIIKVYGRKYYIIIEEREVENV